MEKLYVRFFDIDWDEATNFPKPIASISNFKNNKTGFEIIPTIYITNKTFIQLKDNQLDTLSQLIFNKINQNTEGVSFNEMQIDCDWTESTRERFFTFLKLLKSVSKKQLSATIRLHQVKFSDKTGIPPADKGMLMAYNMGNLDDLKTQNSILDTAILKLYLKNLDNYPLKLDIALPLFSWGVVIRDGEAVKLINNLSFYDFFIIDDNGHSAGLDMIGYNKIRVSKNCYFKGHYLYKDDEIRLEDTPLSILQKTADLLAQHIDNQGNNQQLTVSFYHLDAHILQQYRYEDLQNIAYRFR